MGGRQIAGRHSVAAERGGPAEELRKQPARERAADYLPTARRCFPRSGPVTGNDLRQMRPY